MKNNKGITLIALIITIIVMIILAGITINLLLGENGVIEKTKLAKFMSEYRSIEEGVTLYKAEKDMEEQSEGTVLTNVQKRPVTTALTAEEKNYIKTNIPTLKTCVEEKSGKTIDEVNLYWIDKALINKTEKNNYIIDIDTDKIYDYEGQLALRVRYHVLDGIKGTDNPSGEDHIVNNKKIGFDFNFSYSYGWKICNETYPLEVDKGYSSNTYHLNNSTAIGRTYLLRATGAATLEFDWQVSCEENNDYLYYTLYKDGNAVEGTGISTKITGNNVWTSYDDLKDHWIHKEIDITESGDYCLELTYVKNDSTDGGLDMGFIKDIVANGYIDETSEHVNIAVSVNKTHSPKDLNYTWQELNEIAKKISQNTAIKNTTEEVQTNIGNKNYIVGVGDRVTFKYGGNTYTAHILGFNHDKLASPSNAYGEQTVTGKAGISFETKNYLETYEMNSGETNSGGWAETEMRTYLNGTVINSLNDINNYTIKDYIKEVEKDYMPQHNVKNTSSCNDKLWLLSCSEIWNKGYTTGAYGYAKTKEGEQYQYYGKINASYNVTNLLLVKKDYNGADCSFWLRSPYVDRDNSFCAVLSDGTCTYYNTRLTQGMAFGFSI